jgi:hypothetical protein
VLKPSRTLHITLPLILVSGVLLLPAAGPSSRRAFAPEEAGLTPECQARLETFQANPGWRAALIDPVLTSAETVQARAAELTALYTCLAADDIDLSPELQDLHRLAGYFLAFAASEGAFAGESVLRLVDPATSNDPALLRIREQAGVPPPPGLFFVRLYPSRAAMPGIIRDTFAEDTLGVTILTRYIAVPVEEEAFWAEQVIQSRQLPETISHELVHAYVNASLGADYLPELPDWYSEGLAIYFSGSGERHAVQTPGFSLVVTSPEEYQRYDLNFRYLENRLGQERLHALIRSSLAERDPDQLYRELNLAGEAELAERAGDWWAWRASLRLAVIVSGALLAVWAVAVYIRRFPDTWCIHCDYGGKWRAFKGGRCPRCGLPFNKPVVEEE